jgi:hypothetical protein
VEVHFHRDFLSSLPVFPWVFFPHTQLKSSLIGGINDEEKNFASFVFRRALPGAFVVDVQ